MVRVSLAAAVTAALAGLALAAPASAASGGGSGASDPATSVYVEQVPTAGGSGSSNGGSNGTKPLSDPAASVYEEQIPAAGGTAGASRPGTPGAGALTPSVEARLARQGAAGKALREVATSPSLGAPQVIRPLPGDAKRSGDSTDGTFSGQTILDVANVGIVRLAGLFAVLVLTSVALAVAAFRRFAPR